MQTETQKSAITSPRTVTGVGLLIVLYAGIVSLVFLAVFSSDFMFKPQIKYLHPKKVKALWMNTIMTWTYFGKLSVLFHIFLKISHNLSNKKIIWFILTIMNTESHI